MDEKKQRADRRCAIQDNILAAYVHLRKRCIRRTVGFESLQEFGSSAGHTSAIFHLHFAGDVRPFRPRQGLAVVGSHRLLQSVAGAHIETNAHSESLKHHTAMQALFVAWYNFARKNAALKNQTPAMASGIADHVWMIKELIKMAAAC
jgi:hypothetical protein